MQKAVTLVSLLVLGWSWTLQGLPILPEPLFTTQENFDQTKFLGTWYDVAIATTCSHMQRFSRNAAIGKLELQSSTTEGKIKAIKTAMRHGTCMEISGDYELTSTPGRFFYHIARWVVNVDAYVVRTNYTKYALMIMSNQRSSQEKHTSVKLYSRTKAVSATAMDDFKTLVKQQGMSENNIIIKSDQGDCVPGEQVVEPSAKPEPQRLRRQVVPSLAPADQEGSGDDTSLFNGTEACKAEPDTGPCFGIHHRYFYNSTSMNCQLFKYGGCLGNQNNFENERDCLQRCRTEAVCRLPMSAQPCTGQPPIWAFDSSVGLCVPYKVGFCQANANKFYSKAECDEYCGVVKDEAELLKAN